MNLLLLMIVITGTCAGLCIWQLPAALRWLSAHLLCRADVIDAANRTRAERLSYWQAELATKPVAPESAEVGA